MRIWNLMLVLTCGLAMTQSPAHELWLERDADSYLLYQGHRDSSHAGEKTIVYGPAFVRGAVCLSPDGTPAAVAASGDYPARFPVQCAMLLAEASAGVWTTTVEGTRNQPPGGLTGVVRSWRSLESVKRLDTWVESCANPLGEGLELIPLGNPFILRRGDKLRLLVTLRGVARPGVNVSYAGEPRGMTGPDGRINLRIRSAGRQSIAASTTEPWTEPAIGEQVHYTALQFDLGIEAR